jgi:signal transduction histidine kinase
MKALVAGVTVSVVTLIALAYQGVDGWRKSAASLAERRAHETADLLVRAFGRDMRGVQFSILSSPRWDEFMLDPPYDVGTLVASAFARYPYPESFFAWRQRAAHPAPIFFNRSDRQPPWLEAAGPAARFPVTFADNPAGASPIIARVGADAGRHRTFSVFEMQLGSARYQVVARLLYRDPAREALEAVFGYTVNLGWVRDHYFPEVMRQVARISGAGGSFDLAIVDANGTTVTGTARRDRSDGVLREEFPIMFFDPASIALDPPSDLSRERWSVEVGLSGDPALAQAIQGANRTLLVATVAAGSLGVGLLLSVRAARQSARLAEMRSEFVSAVTHELKTPIATIRAIGDTVVSGRVASPASLQDYAGLIVQEARRLTRLVDNLLAFARVTDVADVYAFEAVPPEQVIEEVLGAFRSQLAEFDVAIDLPPGLPLIRGDRTALRLLFDNLIDNAVRYSEDARRLTIEASAQGRGVTIAVRDRGAGIPADEVGKVTRKFFRGRGAGSGGSGLGLAIVRRIVEDHLGTLEIHSEPGSGTSVIVTLPTAN